MRTFQLKLTIWVTLFTFLDGSVWGQDIADVSLVDQVQQLQFELNDLRSKIADSGQISTDGRADATQCSYPVNCNNARCSSCDSSSSRWTLGYDFVFARPRLLEAFDATVADFATGTQTLLPLDYDFDLTPRIHLGYAGANGVGIRAHYWEYGGESNPKSLVAGPTTRPAATVLTVIFPSTVSTLIPGDVLNVSNSLDTQTLDLEGTYDIHLKRTEMVGSIGLRYATLNQTRTANVISGGVMTQSMDWSRTFAGFGIVAGVEGRRPIRNSGLAAVFKGRASLLNSDKSVNRSVIGDVTPNATLPVLTLENTKETSAIGEIGLGLEYRRQFTRANVFARGMYEGQLWTGVGTPALGFLGFEVFSVGIGAEY